MIINEAQFELIYQEHKNIVFNICVHYLLNTDDAQDVTQEVFVKVYQRYHQYDAEKASLKNWICGIAVNQSLDFLKAKKYKKRFGILSSLYNPHTEEPISDLADFFHPGIAVEQKEALEKLLKIIYALPKHQKTAIILTKIRDHPLREVAEIMNTTVKAVDSLLQRAKKTIQKKLTERERF
jgi:RNA polymerase sigma-70 factor, ECF subfamily